MRKVFVLEERTHIVSELQWQFEEEADRQIRGFSTESILFQNALCETAEELVVIIDLGIGKPVCLQFLQRCLGANVSFPVMIFSAEPLLNLEWALRELGVFHIQAGSLEPERIAKICRWYWGFTEKEKSAIHSQTKATG
ncbi:hypothetical protein [Gimesia fumaroli]|uniref:Response regulatory domain-containing protein n=1 Tax=Gimesia fumaroli TaxID=2527976 RepID=A0A518IIR2_9PLAN|nr:hypothetical protein [Gimesia fumaroli]QDV52930.1 hypothetical protein Enr17x_50000 [Gimesia fumaroli]